MVAQARFYKSNLMPCANGNSPDQLTVTVWRRMYAFHESLPDSRPPPVSFSPPNAPADFRAAGSDVHVGDAAIAAARAQESFGRANAVGENRRRETLRNRVVRGDRVVECIELDQVENRRENFFGDDRHVGARPHQRGFHVAAFETAARR
jgi:hypothetical protein